MNARRIRCVALVGTVAALAAVPVAGAANRTVQVDGRLVAPAQVSEAQLSAGHAASSRLVQIGGTLVQPSQVSPWQARSGSSSGPSGTTAESSSGIGTGGIALIALTGAMALLASSALLVRRRAPLTRAT